VNCSLYVRLILFGAALFTAIPTEARTQALPSVEAKALDGTHFSLRALRGKVVVINYWATWCAPCRAELSAFDAYYLKHRNEGLAILAISMDNPAKLKAVKAIASKHQFSVAMSRDAKVSGVPEPSVLPVTLAFDRGGLLRFDSRSAHTGAMDLTALDRNIGPLLAERTSQ
jgi:cytochrome c biogenesis protein CcmG, thiol:disulfide interchange protein DsbE